MPIDAPPVPPAISIEAPKDFFVDAFALWNGPSSTDNLVVSVDMNGQVTFGPKFKGDEAAREFWKYVGQYVPKQCP